MTFADPTLSSLEYSYEPALAYQHAPKRPSAGPARSCLGREFFCFFAMGFIIMGRGRP
jgi:hypothetical protein